MTAKHIKKSQSHALDLTEHWLRVSIKIIDRNAGEGYAKAHPELEREIAEAEQVTTINVKTGEQTA